MCGELEDDGPSDLEQRLFAAFLVHTRLMLNETTRARHESGSVGAYADRLMGDALNRARRDAEAADPDKRQTMFSVQPLVFARLAGFLASHLPLNEDPLRKVMEAMMLGYADAERLGASLAHDHGDGEAHHH
jgi:hypothetical protein